MNNLNTFAPDLQNNFGTQANFNTYLIPPLVVSNGTPFTQQNRLWVSGDIGLYTADMAQLDSQLTAAAIPHTFVAGPSRAHSWDSGWLPGAVAALDAVSVVRSNGQPSGALPAGVTQTTISLNTDEKATCRYATTAGIPYASMSYAFSATGGISHSTVVAGLTNGGIYSYFVRCSDSLGNSNPEDFAIVVSVANAGDTTPPVRSNGQPTGTLVAGTTADDSQSDDQRECHLPVFHGGRHPLRVDGVRFQHDGGNGPLHRINGLGNGGTYSYYVRCQDASGNANPDDFTIAFSTLASDPASSSFVGVENPLSEGGMWSTAGAWASMAKSNGAYGATTNMAAAGQADGERRSVFGDHLRSEPGDDELGGSDDAGSEREQWQLLSGDCV